MVEGNGSTDGIIPEGEGDSEGDMKGKFIEEKSVSRRILTVTNSARIHKMITAIIAKNAALRFRLSFPSRFSVYVGIYIDFGYILETRSDGTKTQLSHSVVYMGAGGFIGGQIGLGYTWQIFPWGIPCYINLEGNVSATLFLGSSADPNKTLEEYQNTNNHSGSDFGFSVELLLQEVSARQAGSDCIKPSARMSRLE